MSHAIAARAVQADEGAERFAFHEITDASRQALRGFWPSVARELPAILDGFYAHLSGVECLARLIGGQAGRLKGAQATHWERLFSGKFETGLYPDEWNWQEGRDKPDRTRQICNGWKSDRTVASLVLRREIGRLCAQLGRWKGARVVQDNVIWKPAGAKSLGYHQDNSYADWIDPPAMLTCWIALDDTSAAGGTIEYVKGSHKWGRFPPAKQFHAPEDYRKEMAEPEPQQVIASLARLAQHTPLSVGCYCEDETRCNRSQLGALIRQAAASPGTASLGSP